MDRAVQQSQGQPDAPDVNYVTRFQSCSWPPAAGADPDGYALVEVATRQGPGAYEATGTDLADVISGTCSTFRIDSQFASQGAQSTNPPITVGTGERVTIDGKPFSGDVGFYPDPDQAVVLHNAKNEITMATCAS